MRIDDARASTRQLCSFNSCGVDFFVFYTAAEGTNCWRRSKRLARQDQLGSFPDRVVVSCSGTRSEVGRWSWRNVVVNVRSPDTSWVARNTIVEALTKLNYSVYLPSQGGEGKAAIIDLGIVEMKVRYGDVFREGVLGTRKTERTINTTLSANVRNAQNEILFAGAVSRALKDTVVVSDVAQLENSSIAFTHGEPPKTDFFENVLEPVIIIGASAVVVFLFFTVRS